MIIVYNHLLSNWQKNTLQPSPSFSIWPQFKASLCHELTFHSESINCSISYVWTWTILVYWKDICHHLPSNDTSPWEKVETNSWEYQRVSHFDLISQKIQFDHAHRLRSKPSQANQKKGAVATVQSSGQGKVNISRDPNLQIHKVCLINILLYFKILAR